MRTKYPKHLDSPLYQGPQRYFLTFCADNRHLVFADFDAVALVLSQISRAADEEEFAVIAYCFMPDHLHLLVEGQRDDSDCLRFIKAAKQYAGFHYNQRYHRRLWQRYGYEHILRNDEDTFAVARYILENPLRAQLVERVEDYPYVGSMAYELGTLLTSVEQAT
jgi:putative transposase